MKMKVRDYVKIGLREKLIIFCPAVVLVILAFLVAFYFVDPVPPRRISIGCGPPEGADFNYAQAYREILSKEGITLELRNTVGSAQNLQLLGAESGGVDVAFVQGSMKSLVQETDLVSLGSLFFEPLWIFHRNDLAVRRIPDLHPALINLLLEAAKVVHKSGGGFEREGEFPAPKYLDFKLSPEAERFYKSGSPFLQRYLPFWIAIFVSRMAVLLLPLVAVVLPLFKLMPLVYRWRMRSKIYRWYSRLRKFDPERHKAETSDRVQEYLVGLYRIEEKVSNLSVPLSYSEELYHLRMHIDLLRSKLKQMIET
jgi:hypothetical protein